MSDNLDNEMKDFGGEIADTLGYKRKIERTRRRRAFLDTALKRKYLILGGAVVIIVIILIALFSGGTSELSNKDLDAIKVRLDLLEKRLTRLEEVEITISKLEKQGKGLEQSIMAADRSARLLTVQVDALAQKVDMMAKKATTTAEATEDSAAIKTKPPSPGKERYHEVRSGETLYRIAKKYSLSVTELCRLNNITPNKIIHPGQKLLVSQGSD
jgi:LysM repeat protein